MHGINIFGFDPDIAIHHQMEVGIMICTLAEGDIMRFAVTEVFRHRHIADFLRWNRGFLHIHIFLEPCFLAIIQQVNLTQVFDA